MTEGKCVCAGETAFWAGALQYAQQLDEALSNTAAAAQPAWEPLKAALGATNDEDAFRWAFPHPASGVDRRLAAERAQWLPHLLRSISGRIAHDLARYNPDTDMLRWCNLFPHLC